LRALASSTSAAGGRGRAGAGPSEVLASGPGQLLVHREGRANACALLMLPLRVGVAPRGAPAGTLPADLTGLASICAGSLWNGRLRNGAPLRAARQ
jgi:hypothetical protein